jgi:hypothetical protein
VNQPDIGDVHVNAALTDVSIGFQNDPQWYIADQVFPTVPSDKQSNIYLKYNRGDFFQGSEDLSLTTGTGGALERTPGTEAKKVGYRVDLTNTFFCINYAIGVDIPDELRSNADAVFNLDMEATKLATEILRIRREIEWVGAAFRTGVWATDRTGGTDFTQFGDYGGSDPFTEFENNLDSVEAATGVRPNKLVLGPTVWRRLKHHPDFIDRIKGGATTGSPALMTKQQLAAMLEIDQVLVGRGLYRSSIEATGNDTPTLTRIFGSHALLLYTPPSATRFNPAAGMNFYWQPLTGGGMQFIRRYREDKKRKDVIEAHGYWQVKVTETQSGILMASAAS